MRLWVLPEARRKFKQFPVYTELYFTSDKMAFYNESNAIHHSRTLEDREIFFVTTAMAFHPKPQPAETKKPASPKPAAKKTEKP
jgi:hypothetical protein